MEMIVILFTSLLFIGLGFFVVKFPMLISGYNTMSREQREQVDIHSVAIVMRNCFCVMGVLLFAGYFILEALGKEAWIGALVLTVTIGGVIVLFALTWRFQQQIMKQSKSSKISLIIGGVITLFALILVFSSGKTVEISVVNNKLEISGSYSESIPLESITEVTLIEQLPRITMKSNGYAMGNSQQGHFNTSEMGSVKLFLHTGHPPYLLIKSTTTKPIILDRDTREELEELQRQIRGR